MKLNKDVTKEDIINTKQEVEKSLEKSVKMKSVINTERTFYRLSSKTYSIIIMIAIIIGTFIFVPFLRSILDYKEPVPATERALEWVE